MQIIIIMKSNVLYKVTGSVIVTLLMIFPELLVAGTNEHGPKLTFHNEFHSYGQIHVDDVPEGNTFSTEIGFSNTGTEPLIIDSVQVCCNVTLIDYPKEPILPGQNGVIIVELKVHRRVPHRINRSVTVFSNCTKEPILRYRLAGRLIDR